MFLFVHCFCEGQEKIYAIMITGKDAYHYSLAKLSICSFLEQTYPNKYLIIINDGSYSLKGFEKKNLIKEVRLEDKYPLGTLRNVGLQQIPENAVWCNGTMMTGIIPN